MPPPPRSLRSMALLPGSTTCSPCSTPHPTVAASRARSQNSCPSPPTQGRSSSHAPRRQAWSCAAETTPMPDANRSHQRGREAAGSMPQPETWLLTATACADYFATQPATTNWRRSSCWLPRTWTSLEIPPSERAREPAAAEARQQAQGMATSSSSAPAPSRASYRRWRGSSRPGTNVSQSRADGSIPCDPPARHYLS